jgi:hypothetical protein
VSDTGRTGAVHLHEAGLIALAIRFARERPDERAVALVAEGDVREALIFRQAEEEYALRGEDGSAALLVDRERAKRYLVGVAIRGLEYLIDEGSGPVRQLPVVHIAVPGVRMESIAYEAPE